MLNSGKKIRDKKINILTLVLFEKKILNETKNHTCTEMVEENRVPYVYTEFGEGVTTVV